MPEKAGISERREWLAVGPAFSGQGCDRGSWIVDRGSWIVDRGRLGLQGEHKKNRHAYSVTVLCMKTLTLN